ncbi:unnamed protein product [Rotaria magnacalcarata]|uniref:Uncharacterized protein n=1 Tax=Rotaria magnacalcarata TaxID=392030 RepID=A0A816QHJ9_9BILA|nr:unnamed protein product [Rotaria magnacalcarata]CAF2059580.1 unnamed protein product [Rotaria magnacalcarata]CAF4479072.1 unnamed protein product [Rotaria magnacalcarata]CAF4497914.1 unnamed protein product [Rotaria magnacalcarata]CAF4591686.1 unnamed protein product [Rotaria magnacalcarata]
MTTSNTKTPAHASNVYLFKNGYGMIVKTVEFPPSEGNNSKSIELLDPPSNPVHGTFWIQPLSNNIECAPDSKTRDPLVVPQPGIPWDFVGSSDFIRSDRIRY